MDISPVKKLVGKKLLWCGEDKDGRPYILFEGMVAITFDEVTILAAASPTMEALVNENLSHAESVIALKKIMEESKIVADQLRAS